MDPLRKEMGAPVPWDVARAECSAMFLTQPSWQAAPAALPKSQEAKAESGRTKCLQQERTGVKEVEGT